MYVILQFHRRHQRQPGHSRAARGAALQRIINGLAAFGLLACTASAIIGGAAWGLGHQSSNYQYSSGGKKGVLGGIVGAFVIGAAVVVNFFFRAGQGAPLGVQIL